ncbi:serine/threonine-protein kinase [Hyalangium rubrum]|uniref:Serine/threonine-protein kinase n=1 Tax=Hyalangium rubrum TaxID=3103134 RepID=A0ABU5GZ27_9BACT|nr:serine/threonine-protein kinase [Hyalangium sp. s54d21]MDY7225085.1 serine/threonine-protein kinase [Hyalangium sp. s54d21]
MESVHAPGLGPASLPKDTVLGRWRVVARSGRGAYGAVYRAVRLGQEQGPPAALKISMQPREPRFHREVELLSRIRHPGVPALEDSGWWTDEEGHFYPYLVMGWAEGVSLYEWASARRFTSRQVLRLLGQVARALEATHAQGCVHRDVKGDNVLVSPEGRAFLTDFGCGWYPEAKPLTDGTVPPGTPQYRSPQALRFQFQFRRDLEAHYVYPPADDVYALGVTAYRMVTGRYPPRGADPECEMESERPQPPSLLPPRELSTISPGLDALILRMLSEAREERGTAGELARAFEAAAEGSGPEEDAPVGPTPSMAPTVRTSKPGPRPWWARAIARLVPWLAVATVVGGMICVWELASLHARVEFEEELPREVARGETQDAGVDGGVVGLGEGVLTAPVQVSAPVLSRTGVALDIPKEPFKGQRRPPCHPEGEVEIRGGCWVQYGKAEAPCGDAGFEWDGRCYLPIFATPRQPTSDNP